MNAMTHLCAAMVIGSLAISAKALAAATDAPAGTSLPPAAAFHGVVVDADTKRPVTAFRVIGVVRPARQRPFFMTQDFQAPLTMSEAGVFERTAHIGTEPLAFRVEAAGYAPLESPPVGTDAAAQSYTFELHRAPDLTARVVDPDGHPIANARVALARPGLDVSLDKGVLHPRGSGAGVPRTSTDADGRFTFGPQIDPFVVVVTADEGYAKIDARAFGETITLQPWCRIEGTVKVGSKPAAGAQMQASDDTMIFDDVTPRVHNVQGVDADADGQFVFERVTAEAWRMGRLQKLAGTSAGFTWADVERFTTAPGETRHIDIGGSGRPVIAHVEAPAGLPTDVKWHFDQASLREEVARLPSPKSQEELAKMSAADKLAYTKSPQWKAWRTAEQSAQMVARTYNAVRDQAGNLRFDDVNAGQYQFYVHVMRDGDDIEAMTKPLATYTAKVNVVDGDLDTPIDLGTLTPTLRDSVEVGDAAPDLLAATLDGKSFRLSDLRVKFVLVDFWATWCGPCIAEFPSLAVAHQRFKDDPRFAMVAVTLDTDINAARAVIDGRGATWSQTILDEAGREKVNPWIVNGVPACYLIGPDGKVIAKDLRGDDVATAIAKALGNQP